MKNFIQNGDTITLTAPVNVTSGDGVLIGSIFGIACNDALAGTEVEVKRRGVFSMQKEAAEAWAVGTPIYWNQSKGLATKVASVNVLIGDAIAASANPSSTGIVQLYGGPALNIGSAAGSAEAVVGPVAENVIRENNGVSTLTNTTAIPAKS